MSSGKFHSRPKVKFVNAGDHDPSQCNHRLHGKLIHYKPARAIEGKTTVKVYDADGTRELLVPKREPIDLAGIWPKSEFQRLRNQAHVISVKERKAMIAEAEQKKIQLLNESEARKQMLDKAQLDQKAKQGSKLSEVEADAANRSLYVLQRAFELRQEQEDEVKKANGLILATKCLAIRQAQLTEKDLIKKELAEENARLDNMMEQKRQKEIMAEEQKRKAEEERAHNHVKVLKEQIYENEVQKLVEAERKEEESRNINKALIAMQREEEEKVRKKHDEQKKIRDELNKANEDMERYKGIQREEQRIADLRIKEFMRKKAEREAEREAELGEVKAAKEREIARLQALQQKANDQQAANEERSALRIQEEVERQWREKEKKAAVKRKEKLEELKAGRIQQMEDLRRLQALKLERDEQEFHKAAQVQYEQYQKDLEKKKEKREAAIRSRKELFKQINDKERERISQHKEKYEEGAALRLEQEVRDLHIQGVLKKKMIRLRENNVPEHFIKDIARQLKLKD